MQQQVLCCREGKQCDSARSGWRQSAAAARPASTVPVLSASTAIAHNGHVGSSRPLRAAATKVSTAHTPGRQHLSETACSSLAMQSSVR